MFDYIYNITFIYNYIILYNSKKFSLLRIFTYFVSCPKEKISSMNSPDLETESYYGTYLLGYMDYGGADIHYLTIDILTKIVIDIYFIFV